MTSCQLLTLERIDFMSIKIDFMSISVDLMSIKTHPQKGASNPGYPQVNKLQN